MNRRRHRDGGFFLAAIGRFIRIFLEPLRSIFSQEARPGPPIRSLYTNTNMNKK